MNGRQDPLQVAIWAYPWDLLDEGVPQALDRMRSAAGVTAVNVATIYHAGKFLLPHNPARRVLFPESGTLYYRPGGWHGTTRITPPVWPRVQEADFWPELRRETRDRGIELGAWIVALHNSGIGFAYPDCAIQNAFGDRIPTDLCANHLDVREYIIAATGDIAARLRVDRILIESLEYMPFQHGYHHEVIGVPTGPTVNLLLSMCFCAHCDRAAAKEGVPLESVRAWIRETLDEHFADPYGRTLGLTWDELRGQAGGAMGGLLDLRQHTLSSLLDEVVRAIRAVSEARIALCDFGPLYPSGADGRAWENGVDLAVQLPMIDEIHPTFYFTDPEVHRTKVAEYLDVWAGETPMVPAIRAILPQTPSREALVEQLQPLAAHAAGFSFYNYGFMPIPTLEWIRDAIASVTDVRAGADRR